MSRSIVLGWLLLILTLSTLTVATPAEGQPHSTDLTVVVVQAGSLDWPEARRSVEAELGATGFKVLSHPSAARTPGQLIDELRRVGREAKEVRGSVAVFEESGEGRAYVWIPERENLFQVDVPPESRRVAAEVLSLRIVELLRVRLLAEPPTPAPPEEPARGLGSVWLAAGPWLGPNLSRPTVQLGVGATFQLLDPLQLDVTGHLSALDARARTEAGTIHFSATQFTAHALWHRSLAGWLSVGAGAGGGVVVFNANAVGTNDFLGRASATTVGLTSLRVRLNAKLGEFAFLLLVEPGVTIPAIAADADQREVFRFGQPAILTAAGVGWAR